MQPFEITMAEYDQAERTIEAIRSAVGNRADMAVGAAGGHHHQVCNRGFSGEVEGDDVLRLHLIETVEDKLQRLRGVTHLGNGSRYGCGTRPRDDLCCQWSFPSYGYTRQRWGLSTDKCRHEW